MCNWKIQAILSTSPLLCPTLSLMFVLCVGVVLMSYLCAFGRLPLIKQMDLIQQSCIHMKKNLNAFQRKILHTKTLLAHPTD